MKETGLSDEIAALRGTLRELRGKNGCPWDRQRTLDEIISYLIDEAYELLHAEKTGDQDHLEEELGDVLFLVVFIHELMLERRESSLSGIVKQVHDKIISRHPHVFGETRATDCSESIAEWERIKLEEKGEQDPGNILSTIPSVLPPLRRAFHLQKKAAGVGFDWPDHSGAIEKLREETTELEGAVKSGDREMIRDEIGDLFFTVVNIARKLHVDSESALEGTSAKFVRRFESMEKKITADGKKIADLAIEELEDYWQASK